MSECTLAVGDATFLFHEYDEYDPLTRTYTPLSPDSVIARLMDPGGNTSIIAVNELAEGKWTSGPYLFDEPGLWRWTVQSTGGVTSVDQGQWTVIGQKVPSP